MAAYLFVQRALRRERVFRDRTQPLDTLNDVDLISRYRFPRRILLELIDGVDINVRPSTNRSHSIPTQLQVLCTLRYLAKADFFSEVGDIHGISRASVCVCLPRVCRALNSFLDNVNFPMDPATLTRMKEEFYAVARFPNVIGAIDGTLIPIRGMSGDLEPVFVCRKNFHALNIQGVVDANMRFININCRYPGSTHDSYIYHNSSLPGILDALPRGGWLLGDSGYPLKDNLMTPFSHPSTVVEERYNQAHSRTRNVVERAFGVLKSRFRCLHSSGGALPFKPEKCSLVIETCMRLHNKAVQERVPLQQGGAVANHQNNAIYQGAAPQTARDMRQLVTSRI